MRHTTDKRGRLVIRAWLGLWPAALLVGLGCVALILEAGRIPVSP